MGDTFSEEFQKQLETQMVDFESFVDTFVAKIPRNEEIAELAEVVKEIYLKRIKSGNAKLLERKK